MKTLKAVIFAATLLTAIPIDRARADFLGLAPGDYTITLQQHRLGPDLLSGLTGRVHIPSDPVTTSNFSWYIPLRDIVGPVLLDWTGELLLAQGGPDESSWAYEEATGPGRVCEGGNFSALCYPTLYLFYSPNRNIGPCNEGGCPRFFQENLSYIVWQLGGWSAQAVPEPSPIWLILAGAALIAVSKCRYL